MPLKVLSSSVSQHCLKVVCQVVLVGVLTFFWLQLVVKGWQQAGANQIERAGAGVGSATPAPS